MSFQLGNKLRFGIRHSEETRQKISKSHEGKIISEETRQKISLSNIGRIFSEEHKKKIGLASKKRFLDGNNPFKDQKGEKHPLYGKKHSEETRKKMSESGRNRPPKTEETRRKISEIHKGIKFSDEHKKRMSEAAKKRPQLSRETRELIGRLVSKTLTGRKRPPFSSEWRRKQSEARRGEKSKLWRGGVTPLIKQIRHCFKYRQWRSDNFTRDNYTCQMCDKIGGTLHVDHYPKSFAQIFYENNIKTYERALACNEFWDINNGRTLCLLCHKKTNTYMKKL